MDICVILWLDSGAIEVWRGRRAHIYQYALEEARPFHLRDAEEDEARQALPFFWGYRKRTLERDAELGPRAPHAPSAHRLGPPPKPLTNATQVCRRAPRTLFPRGLSDGERKQSK